MPREASNVIQEEYPQDRESATGRENSVQIQRVRSAPVLYPGYVEESFDMTHKTQQQQLTPPPGYVYIYS